MEEPNLYEFNSYKDYLKIYLELERGLRSRLAEHLGCQSGFISQVLNGDRHFSLEHTVEICQFLKFDENEEEYFFLLVNFERAGSEKLKDYYSEKIHKKRTARQRIPVKLQEFSEVELATFYSNWIYFAIYDFLRCVKVKGEVELAELLNFPLSDVEKAFALLKRMNLLVFENKKFSTRKAHLSIGRDTPYLASVHRNFRLQAIQSLERRKAEDSHYSQHFVVSKEKAAWIQEKIALFIKEIGIEWDEPEDSSKQKLLFSFALDCFRYGPE